MTRLKLLTLLILITLATSGYLLTLVGISGTPKPTDILNKLDSATKPFAVSPERARYILTYNLAKKHSFALDRASADAAAPDVGYTKGKFYIFFAPGMSVFATPFFMLGDKFNLGQVASFSVVAIFALLNLITLYKIARQMLGLPFWASLVASLIFGYASSSWSYSVSLYQHQATTFFLISGIYGAWLFKNRGRWGIVGGLWTWASYALAATIDYPNVLLLFPMMVYFFFNAFSHTFNRGQLKINFRLAFFACSFIFIAITALHGFYNLTNFGGVTKQSGSLTGYKTAIAFDQKSDKNIEETTRRVEEEKNPVGFFHETYFARGLRVLTISDERGLFFYFPVFILGILAIIKTRRSDNSIIWVLLASLLIPVFLYSSWGDPWGGWAFGPRYLIPSTAILSLFIAIWIVQKPHLLLRKITTLILFAFSSAIAVLGVLTTHSVPPASEAKLLGIGYNYLYNLRFFFENNSSSFIYNTYFKSHLSLWQYALIIYIPLLLIFAFVIFIMPKIKAYDD